MNNPKLTKRFHQLEQEGFPTELIYAILLDEFPNSLDKDVILNDIRENNNMIFEEMIKTEMIPFHELYSNNTIYGQSSERIETEKNESKEGEETERTEE